MHTFKLHKPSRNTSLIKQLPCASNFTIESNSTESTSRSFGVNLGNRCFEKDN